MKLKPQKHTQKLQVRELKWINQIDIKTLNMSWEWIKEMRIKFLKDCINAFHVSHNTSKGIKEVITFKVKDQNN